MKKNAMLKIAAILMVAVLLTTCAISSTFAKYVTNESATATANVAKWGVDVTTSLDSLFATEYATTTNTAPNALSTTEIVAPGTFNKLTLESVATGTPEVSVTLSYDWEVEYINFGSYDPIEWRINSTSDDDWKSYDDIKDIFDDLTVTYAAGTDLSTAKTASSTTNITIEWRWAFETGNDNLDTALGDAAADGEEMPSIKVTFTTNIEQSGAPGDPV